MCTNQVEKRELNYTAEHLRSELSQNANCPLCMNDVESLIADCLTLHARLAAFERLRAAAEAAYEHLGKLSHLSIDGSCESVEIRVQLDTALAALPPASEKGGA